MFLFVRDDTVVEEAPNMRDDEEAESDSDDEWQT